MVQEYVGSAECSLFESSPRICRSERHFFDACENCSDLGQPSYMKWVPLNGMKAFRCKSKVVEPKRQERVVVVHVGLSAKATFYRVLLLLIDLS